MRYVQLEVIEDLEFGGLGLAFKNRKFCNGMFTTQEGLVVAHDLIEHQQGTAKIGSIGDEMIALGGVCFTRAQWGDMRRDSIGSMYTPEQNISSDIIHMGRLYLDNGVPMRQPLKRVRSNPLECIVDSVIDYAREDIRSELDEPCSQEQIDNYLEQCRLLMTQGISMANRRFGNGLVANNQFWAIEQKVSDFIHQIEYAGQQFRLGYGEGKCVMSEVYPEY